MAVAEHELRPDVIVHHHAGVATPEPTGEVDQLAINTIRTLAIDGVEAAGAGHPGTPMALAPLAYVLFTRLLAHDPSDPAWPDRDRVVLSAGHASMLLYAVLHLCGYDLPLDELKRFRQFGSRCPGHPERGVTAGVEVTTGPLGQGFANAVGMAIAERMLAVRFNRPDHEIVNHHTYVICSDGDLMEGVSAEAASLAGNLHLGKLIVCYDDNHISIEGSTELAFCEQVGKRFEAYGWQVLSVADVNDLSALEAAVVAARAETDRPSLVIVQSVIGYGAPTKAGTAAAHGAPLGPEEARAAKENLGWPYPEPFTVPEAVREVFARTALEAGRARHGEWEERFAAYDREHLDLGGEFRRVVAGDLPEAWAEALPSFPAEGSLATRTASGRALNALAPVLPELMGGSADLAPSTDTYLEGFGDVSCREFSGRNFHFGVREHAMGSILNGVAAHGGLRPYGGTFFVFSDYMRPAIRMAALMGLPVVFVFTHDSIGLGEDGPTHQPVEHLLALRAIPDLVVVRPADANETAQAWGVALEQKGPSALVLTRQKIPVLAPPPEAVSRGAYVVAAGDDVALVATGSEVRLALAARDLLARSGIVARVVSMPSWELFAAQPASYRDEVLPATRPRLAVEAARGLGWCAFADAVVSLDRFGASAPADALFEAFGFTAANVAARAQELLGDGDRRP